MARILIIEDNATNLNLMSYLLGASGHAIEGARDGQSGLQAARSNPPDLVLCDIQLPRISGYEIARTLRAEPGLRGLPLVAVTAMAMRGDREQGLAAGFDGYIEKPLQPETFAADVEGFLPPALRKGLPGMVAHPPAAPVPETRPGQGRQRTVLVVDDVPANVVLTQVILQSAGYRVLGGRDMQRGLELMRREMVDLVMTDVHMGSGDGFAFRRAASAEPGLARIPFIFISSSVVTEQDRRDASTLGACQLLERPLEPARLLEAVGNCLKLESGPV